MPEGDTIFRTAETLRQVLCGRDITGFRSTVEGIERAQLTGRKVTQVESRGKNLLVHFSGGRILYTHMRMTGSWHIYRQGERWQKPERFARVVLETERCVAVCFSAPVVELLTTAALKHHPVLARLGPDLLASHFDGTEAARRLTAYGEVTIGEALMIQSAVAGIGNVYKSEVLFLCNVNPFSRVADLTDEEIDSLLQTARRLLLANRHGYPRVTRPARRGISQSSRLWVYQRSGRPCRRCTTQIRMRRQGRDGRSTYWCPTCQDAASAH